ncbi:MAG: ATP-binding protein [Clostridia bacterium]|nr:ATP-binding protein [Clostridia bacterium]
MRELSLNILDIAQNSIAAGASLITIEIAENTQAGELTITVGDNGCGMTEEQLKNVLDPFFTTRTTRKVGMGIPLFKLAAEQTGGSLKIESEKGKGTTTSAVFKTDSIDFTPLGDVTSTVTILISMNTDRDFIYTRRLDSESFELSTVQLKEILEGVPLSEPEVVQWMKDYINEQTNILLGGVNQ